MRTFEAAMIEETLQRTDGNESANENLERGLDLLTLSDRLLGTKTL